MCWVTSVVSNSFWPARLLCAWDFPGKNTGVGCHSLLQGIFPTQGSNPHLLCLLRSRWILYPLRHLGAKYYLYCLQHFSWMYDSSVWMWMVLPLSWCFPPIIRGGLLFIITEHQVLEKQVSIIMNRNLRSMIEFKVLCLIWDIKGQAIYNSYIS